MFTYTALESPVGAQDLPENSSSTNVSRVTGLSLENVHQSVIKFDPDISILVDLGWNADFSLDLEYLAPEIHNADLVLLTHATIAHLGAYAYLYSKYPELARIPVYATSPVVALGKLMTLDMYRSAGLVGPFEGAILSVEEVEAAFDHISQLKYHQPISLAAKLSGVVICAFNSGHSLGGTIWKISKDQEKILYAVEWSHSKDALHNGSMVSRTGEVYDSLINCDAVISSTNTSVSVPLKKRRQDLCEEILTAVDKNGQNTTVLLPTSNGSRSLELAYILDNFWAENKIKVPLYFLSYTGARAVTQASTLIEWMSKTVIGQWESTNRIPFGHSCLKYANSLEDLAEGPKVVLASGENLEVGWSKLLFSQLSSDSNTTLILTEMPAIGTLADTLYKMYVEKSVPASTRFDVNFFQEVALKGSQLDEYNKQQMEQRRQDELQNAIDMRNKNILEQEEGDSSEDEDENDEMLRSGKIDVSALAYGNIFDYDLRGDPKGRTRMFPYHVKRKRFDDYGQIIKFDDFSKATEHGEEEVEISQAQQDAEVGPAKIGEKRKWANEEMGTLANNGDDHDKQDNNDEMDVDNRGILEANNAAQASISLYNQPTKISTCNKTLVVNCVIKFMDFSGLTDETSIKMILPKLRASKLFLVPSRSLANGDLVESLKNADSLVDVVEPNLAVSTGTNTHSYSVVISPELARLMRWQKVFGNVNVAHITGRLQISTEPEKDGSAETLEVEHQSPPQSLPSSEENKVDEQEPSEQQLSLVEEKPNRQVYTLVPLQTLQELAQAPRTTQLYVGDIKLAELKKRLIAGGHKAEFRAEGVLVCDDKVAIRKTAEGRVSLEGGVGKEFYETKKAIRSLLAIV